MPTLKTTNTLCGKRRVSRPGGKDYASVCRLILFCNIDNKTARRRTVKGSIVLVRVRRGVEIGHRRVDGTRGRCSGPAILSWSEWTRWVTGEEGESGNDGGEEGKSGNDGGEAVKTTGWKEGAYINGGSGVPGHLTRET